MKKAFFLLMVLCISFHALLASDTTSVKIFFAVNEFTLAESEQEILDGVLPDDSSIILKNIRIYGYCDSSEKDDKKHTLSLQRANEVKKYLISKGIVASLISTVEGKGRKIFTSSEGTQEQAREAWIIIEYEAVVTEEPIIIKSTRKKKEDDQ